MTGEERWQQAFDDEEREPTDWDPDVAALERRLTDHLARRGCEWPAIAAAVIAARAFGHLDRATFADRIGLTEHGLRTLEGDPPRLAN